MTVDIRRYQFCFRLFFSQHDLYICAGMVICNHASDLCAFLFHQYGGRLT